MNLPTDQRLSNIVRADENTGWFRVEAHEGVRVHVRRIQGRNAAHAGEKFIRMLEDDKGVCVTWAHACPVPDPTR